MPRNGSGDYSLPGPNPYPAVTATVISSSAFNTMLGDLQYAMTHSLSRDGQGGMLAPFGFLDGTVSSPGATFAAEPNSGLFRAGPGDVEMSILGATITRWTSSGFFQVSLDNGVTWKTPVYNAPVLTVSTTSTGLTSTSSASFVAVINATVTFVANGGPVTVSLIHDGSANNAVLEASCLVEVGASAVFAFSADGGSTFFGIQALATVPSATTGGFSINVPASSLNHTYTPSAGSVTVALYQKALGTGSTAHVNYVKLAALQA